MSRCWLPAAVVLVVLLFVGPAPALAGARTQSPRSGAADAPPVALPTERVVLGVPYPEVDGGRRYYVHTANALFALKFPALHLPGPGESVLETWSLQRFALPGLAPAGETRTGTLPPGASFEDLVELGGHAYVLYSLPSETAVAVYALELETTTGGFIDVNAGHPLFTTVSPGASPDRDDILAFWVGPRFKFTASPGGKTVLAVYKTKPANKNDTVNREVYGFHVLAAATAKVPLHQIWTREVQLPYTEERMDTWAEAVDDTGTAYVAVKVREGDGKRDSVGHGRDAPPAYHAEILRLSQSSAGFDVTPLFLGGKYIHL